ncbi:hypothetical protein TNCV_5075282 [Trichonephila clavipes]|uniref:Uncharacterized protein n=1 Tax=Trichonephila clavipes TaxID=2585209 RepID=A0A8X6RUX1_TRICX|nr:hypothetical protein TNCV_5075282 [Trichonephila clavipes]
MEDIADPRNARLIVENLETEDIPRVKWSAISVVFNPFKHVWKVLGKAIVARQPPTCPLPELKSTLRMK